MLLLLLAQLLLSILLLFPSRVIYSLTTFFGCLIVTFGKITLHDAVLQYSMELYDDNSSRKKIGFTSKSENLVTETL